MDSSEQSKRLSEKRGYTFTILADTDRAVIRKYDLLHAGGGPTGDIARPAEFLLDADGVVRWVNLTDDYRVRARAEDILATIDRLGLATEPSKSK